MREAGDKLGCDRVRYKYEDNWDSVGRPLRRKSSWWRYRDNDVDLAPNEFSCIATVAFILLIGESVHQYDITTFDVTKSLQTLLNLCEVYSLFLNAACMPQDADCRNSYSLLRARRERPSDGRPGNYLDEIASSHLLPPWAWDHADCAAITAGIWDQRNRVQDRVALQKSQTVDVAFGSWLCKNAAAPKRSRITFGQITVKDAKILKLVRFCLA